MGKFYNSCPEEWKGTEAGQEQIKIIDKIIDKHIMGASILLIGAGHEEEQYVTWPLVLKKAGANKIEYIEAWEAYCYLWVGREFKITHGDARNLDKHFDENSFDIVCFLQGPEHVKQEEMEELILKMKKVSKKLILLTCPYGNYYDYQEAIKGNPFEIHVQKDMTEKSFVGIKGINIKTVGKKNNGDAAIIIWSELDGS